ncbi:MULTISPECIES: hypothetical protein [Clostridium]|uniref:Phage head-tail adaptor n=4 Tax=Clostridium TaxID=1485 RepID=D8GJB1_CLOLD|nr:MULTISPECIES: hypothetical protein [Clostridium]ADK17199.1 conserved hypothetical protein [Clostridium ljungdahlii DSM 13528]AGY76238.1 hypothetical protein CAETHG_2019 [Clostridium autoethanogenum DSM 10061]ALU36400.1 Hypothetical protein CLAU_1971 [Clostridium autoethanogenum DSM 10061]OAA84624.1 hypothetical protein WX45_00890 [Clostridium ljungdahlii DSM 13528]OAA93054.1 hypothetical protein WX73_00372 [Clostridium coskatii]
MRKRSIICTLVLIIFSCSLICGCNLNKKEDTKESNESFDMKAAGNTVDTYMKYLMKSDVENIKKLYSKELLKSPIKSENQNLKIVGYSLSDSSEIGKSGQFKVKVARVDLSKPFAVLDEYSIKVVKEGNDYKIDKTSDVVDREAFIEKDKIKMRNKNDVKTNVVIDITNVPNYVFPKDDKVNIDKAAVPKNNFGIIDFSYTGDNMAMVTYNKDSYIGVIKIDESMSAQSQDSDGQQGDGGDSKDGGEGGKKGEVEKTVGKNITTLDLLKGSKVEFVTFSQDEKFVMAQYTNANIGHCIRLYKANSGDIVDYKFEEKFPLDKVDVVFSSFDEDILNFDVTPKNNSSESLSKLTGKWKLSLKNFKAVKM